VDDTRSTASTGLGQSRNFGCVPVTSDLTPTPDVPLHRNNWRYVP